ncbi:unnamed protein product [Paramecium sonneborni]|uniref:Vps16 N-terminal domain-containing protein n=1 Tax=Paramecium sonneborni TaxID=65129 RepID=A0A8S1N6N4_9CILI|nr:unnamed protein product [Paramecium sonneborni]
MPIDLKEEDIKKEETAEKDITKIERPRKMVFCRDDCVVLQLQQYIVLVSQDSYTKVKMSNPHFQIKQEYDGVRILTQKKNEILRKLPDSFVNGLNYILHMNHLNKRILLKMMNQIQKTELGEAVNDCIKSGQFEINPEYQMKLLKAASYGKTFLGNQLIYPNLLNETCKYLRVSNALRRNGTTGGRVVTYEQTLQLIKNPDLFITLLLKYNLHYLVIEISRFLKYQIKQKSTIYTHWACCKVESQQDDEQLCQIIKEKIKEQKGISFTQIAQKSIEIVKSQLDRKLLDNEQSLSKRIPVLIWMANYQQGNNNSYYEKALIDAINSKDSNLIYLVIMKFLKTDMDETYKFGILSQNQISQAHLIYYLRNFDDKYQQKYLQYLKNMMKVDIQPSIKLINKVAQMRKLDFQNLLRNSLKKRVKIHSIAKCYKHKQEH